MQHDRRKGRRWLPPRHFVQLAIPSHVSRFARLCRTPEQFATQDCKICVQTADFSDTSEDRFQPEVSSRKHCFNTEKLLHGSRFLSVVVLVSVLRHSQIRTQFSHCIGDSVVSAHTLVFDIAPLLIRHRDARVYSLAVRALRGFNAFGCRASSAMHVSTAYIGFAFSAVLTRLFFDWHWISKTLVGPTAIPIDGPHSWLRGVKNRWHIDGRSRLSFPARAVGAGPGYTGERHLSVIAAFKARQI